MQMELGTTHKAIVAVNDSPSAGNSFGLRISYDRQVYFSSVFISPAQTREQACSYEGGTRPNSHGHGDR